MRGFPSIGNERTQLVLPYYLYNPGGTATNKMWGWAASANKLQFGTLTDAYAAGSVMVEFDRSGTTAGYLNFQVSSLQYGGLEVGFRGLNLTSKNVSDTTTSDLVGKGWYHPSGAGAGHTWTIDNSAHQDSDTLTFVNLSTNAVSIACSGTTMYLAGTTTSGTRTLAQNGYCVAEKVGGIWLISGPGLT